MAGMHFGVSVICRTDACRIFSPQSVLLCINGVAILNNERFLEKCEHMCTPSPYYCITLPMHT